MRVNICCCRYNYIFKTFVDWLLESKVRLSHLQVIDVLCFQGVSGALVDVGVMQFMEYSYPQNLINLLYSEN